jgi:nucleoside-diphosphate-sugar epimerase
LTGKYIPVVGSGKARWNNVHVHDLSQLFLLLTEAAASSKTDGELWGAKGYYLAENGEHLWTDLAEKIAKEAEKMGYVGSLEKQSLSKEKALDQAGFEAVSWGFNSRGKAERARKLVGWKPSAPSIEDEVPNIIKDEYERLSGKQ